MNILNLPRGLLSRGKYKMNGFDILSLVHLQTIIAWKTQISLKKVLEENKIVF